MSEETNELFESGARKLRKSIEETELKVEQSKEDLQDLEKASERANTTLQFANNLYTNALGATASLKGESGLGVINDIMESRDRAEDLYNKTEKLLKKMRGE